MASREVLAICCSCIHFSEQPPVARSVESKWLDVQEGYVEQLRQLQTRHNAPILVAGDFFHKWNSSPLLIGCVIRWLQGMRVYGIPGNHDLPNHNYLELARSAYWVLVEAGVVRHLTPGGTHTIGSLVVHPFPYGFDVTPPNHKVDLCQHVALIHAYIWTKKTGHVGAAESYRYSAWMEKLKGYDAAVLGDNHIGFSMPEKKGGCNVVNCGGFMRRNSDQKDYKPRVYLLYSDGTFSPIFLDCVEDKFLEVEDSPDKPTPTLDLADFVGEMAAMQGERLDYAKAALRALEREKLDERTKTLILRAIGVNGMERRK